jgi:hypothetical protein
MSRDAMRQAAVRELVDGFFDGSEAALAAFLREPAAQAAVPPERAYVEDRIDTVLL